MYVLPSDAQDDARDSDGTLGTSVAAFQTWLGSQTQGRHLRVDTYQNTLDITLHRLSRSDAAIRASGAYVRDKIEEDLRAAGFDKRHKLYCTTAGAARTPAAAGHGPPA